jgi:hypothetical protein
LRELTLLKFERCQIDSFAPKGEISEKLLEISVEGNKLEKLDFNFGERKVERLNFSSNIFKAFPYDELKSCKSLV